MEEYKKTMRQCWSVCKNKLSLKHFSTLGLYKECNNSDWLFLTTLVFSLLCKCRCTCVFVCRWTLYFISMFYVCLQVGVYYTVLEQEVVWKGNLLCVKYNVSVYESVPNIACTALSLILTSLCPSASLSDRILKSIKMLGPYRLGPYNSVGQYW